MAEATKEEGLRGALESAREAADAISSKAPGAIGEASRYGERWADEVLAAKNEALAAVEAALAYDEVPDAETDAFAADLLAGKVGAGAQYERMLEACDHAGEDGGAMQDLCYELEDLFNAMCGAWSCWCDIEAGADGETRAALKLR